LPWNDAGDGNKAIGNDEEHGYNATYANVLQLQHDWEDASLECWQQRGGQKGKSASATGGKEARATWAMVPA
jgi:hypothetical protein